MSYVHITALSNKVSSYLWFHVYHFNEQYHPESFQVVPWIDIYEIGRNMIKNIFCTKVIMQIWLWFVVKLKNLISYKLSLQIKYIEFWLSNLWISMKRRIKNNFVCFLLEPRLNHEYCCILWMCVWKCFEIPLFT